MENHTSKQKYFLKFLNTFHSLLTFGHKDCIHIELDVYMHDFYDFMGIISQLFMEICEN
jgi:hypothetical protein